MEIDIDLKKRLDEAQNKIIDSDEKYLVVSACPGSGKTYTVVKKIEKELEEIKKHKGIIACSFTNEAASELKNRINKSIDLSTSFIGTLDSFVKDIIYKYINRLLKYKNSLEKIVIIKEIIFPDQSVNDDINKITKFFYSSKRIREEGIKYWELWLKKLRSGKYEISFPTYMMANEIAQLKVFNEYFAERYTTLYIDEAQDLNCFQHELINTLRKKTNINIIMVGDPLQSIYQFRGAKPELFNDLENSGYKKYLIDVSVRCHPSIMYYANKIYELPENELDGDNRVCIMNINDLTLEFLKSLTGGIFILTENNRTAIEQYEKYKSDFDIIYTKRLDNMPSDYNLNKDIIDELIKYYLNYDNEKDIYKYPADQLLNILFNMNKKVRKSQLYVNNRNIDIYLKEILDLLQIELSQETINNITQKLEDEKYKCSYFVVDKDNRIMTIHASKGLENDNIIVILNSAYNKINENFKNKLFVAITRAKNNVFIISNNNANITNFINDLVS